MLHTVPLQSRSSSFVRILSRRILVYLMHARSLMITVAIDTEFFLMCQLFMSSLFHRVQSHAICSFEACNFSLLVVHLPYVTKIRCGHTFSLIPSMLSWNVVFFR